ncbi:MAG: hypothetical protein EB127_12025 [Alphaproteobacteria bacterium]|nr:hypothetical protein [Alphaproteobacteria bacterium]
MIQDPADLFLPRRRLQVHLHLLVALRHLLVALRPVIQPNRLILGANVPLGIDRMMLRTR